MSDRKDFDTAFDLIVGNAERNKKMRGLTKEEYCDRALEELSISEEIVMTSVLKGLGVFIVISVVLILSI